MNSLDDWSSDYFEEKFSSSDPWRYFTSPFERMKYKRQLDIIKENNPNPREILEIGCAEGAMTILLAESFLDSRITAIEISSKALMRARDNLKQFEGRIEFIHADIAEYLEKLMDNYFDILVWSESIYYLGARFPIYKMYGTLIETVKKLKQEGLLIMANVVDLPKGIPESIITEKPIINLYFSMLSNLAFPLQRVIYQEEKGEISYEYQIWVFKR